MIAADLIRINDEVWVAPAPVVQLGAPMLDFIAQQARSNQRGRARICIHKHATNPIHEMMIALRSNTYVQPHRHAHKTESFHLVSGIGDVVIFHEDGTIRNVIRLSKDDHFYYRLENPYYHTVCIRSELLIIHEVTAGPFHPSETEFASFAPAEFSPEVACYKTSLDQQIEDWSTGMDPI